MPILILMERHLNSIKLMLTGVNNLFNQKYNFFCLSSTVMFSANMFLNTTVPSKIAERVYISLDSGFTLYTGFQNVHSKN